MERKKKYSLLSLLIIVGILMIGLSNGSILIIGIGGIITFIGGFSFGTLISINTNKNNS